MGRGLVIKRSDFVFTGAFFNASCNHHICSERSERKIRLSLRLCYVLLIPELLQRNFLLFPRFVFIEG
jgi:hypothetical protein